MKTSENWLFWPSFTFIFTCLLYYCLLICVCKLFNYFLTAIIGYSWNLHNKNENYVWAESLILNLFLLFWNYSEIWNQFLLQKLRHLCKSWQSYKLLWEVILKTSFLSFCGVMLTCSRNTNELGNVRWSCVLKCNLKYIFDRFKDFI